MPNRFFADDGGVIDMAGADWQALWGPLHAARQGASRAA